MIKQNIFIVNFNSLYEILEEIKENLSFNIIRYENVGDFNIAEHTDIKKSLIIIKPNQNLLVNENLKVENFFNLKNAPLRLNKLIELINVHLIKLKFNYQSKIIIKDYELNLNSKFFSKDNIILKLTEKEIQIILYLRENKKKNHVLDLQKNIWSYSSDMETHTVETHIYRLRKKISDKFKDENFILSHKNGYFIDQNSN
jgi:DNA-binding winged helix-turn-helix (wHTH) protein